MEATNPDVPLFLHKETLPPGARPFDKSLYGFKPWCVQECLNAGYTKIIFIDCTCVVQDKLDYYDQFAEEYGGVLAVGDENKLGGFCYDKALAYIGKNRKWIEDKHLVGGSFYYFNFEYELCQKLFSLWKKSEQDGLFGNMVEQCSEQLKGHRSDEAMMSLCLYLLGSKPFTGATRYNWEKGGVIQKMHFK